jgi:serine/threonine protein kinase
MSTLKKPVPFGKYYLLERINVGGMAEVFKAKTFGVEGFERLLAVKRILPNIAEDEEFITMFIDEAKIAVQLQHANIAQIFDLGKVDESYFIALEYVNGRDLRSIFDRMRSRGEALPIALACHVMMQICEGLDYAHNKRDGQGRELHLIHRDISPQNVLIGYDGEVKLIDFGIAKAAGKASTTQAGILKGKFGYMSPEQVRGLPIDKRSDIFAVGIVLYELLTGERLFVGETDFSTLEKVRNVEIVPPSSYNKKIPQELERLMMKALARDPEDRYSNAIDLHDDLQSFLYSIGEFYSRKDLAGWMKKTFAAEIEEDNAKIEQYRQIAAPVGASNEVSRRAAVAGAGSRVGAPPAPSNKDSKNDKNVSSAMGWDDEELDTQIFDKTDESAPDKTVEQSAADLFFEDDDRTVANEPPPDILEQARPPDILATPRPQRKPTAPLRTLSEDIGLTPPPLTPPKPPMPRRPTLTGVPATPLRSPTRPLASLPPPPVPPSPPRTTPAQLRRSGLNLPPAQLAAPPTPSSTLPYAQQPPGMFAHPAAAPLPPPPPPLMPAPMPPPRQTFPQPHQAPAPFGTGNFSDELSRGRSKGGGGFLKVAIVLLLAAGGSGAYWYMTTTKPGRMEITTVPADATVLVDNTKVGDHSPVSLERSPGPYTVSVTRDGYVRNDQNVEVHAGQPLPLTVTLEPSPDTGFELTSEPPGGLVWLDGAPIQGAAGQQARTDFRAFRIAPGHHLLEIKGENRFKPWRQDVEVEPGAIQKVHAMLIPAAGSSGSTTAGSGKTPSHPEAAVAPPPPAPPAPHDVPPSPSPSKSAETHEALVAPSPPSSPHVPRHKKAHDVGLDDSGDGAAASADDDNSSPKGDCSMTVNSVPWSEVWIDGKNTSQHTPVVDFKIPCGKHKLAFKRSDMQIDHSENITVRPGQNFKQRYTLATDE